MLCQTGNSNSNRIEGEMITTKLYTELYTTESKNESTPSFKTFYIFGLIHKNKKIKKNKIKLSILF